MQDRRFISIVIPNRNGAGVIRHCLSAAFAADYPRFEVVVVDDASDDDSVDVIRRFPCKLVRLPERGGVSKARNAGARAASGELLLFIDNDCLLEKGALSVAEASYGRREDLVLGGTYTPSPYDEDFFSAFQSVFINHFETKRLDPDYVAAHAMVIDAELFRRSGGFIEDSFIGVAASVEDVEFCHRLRRSGCELAMNPELRVQHVFRFSLRRSLANAVKKARFWTMYSMANRDVLTDSGTASHELKANVAVLLAHAIALASSSASGSLWPLAAVAPLLALDLHVNRKLIGAWYSSRGLGFSVLATGYYMSLWAAAVGVGAAAGAAHYLWSIRILRKYRSCTARFDTRGLSS